VNTSGPVGAGRNMATPVDAVAGWMAFLHHDLSTTFFPAAYFRAMFAQDTEHRLLTLAAGLLVGYFTLSLFREEGGTWLRLLAVMAAQGASFAVVHPSWRGRLVGVVLGAAAAAISLGHEWLGFMALAAAAIVVLAPGVAALAMARRGLMASAVLLLALVVGSAGARAAAASTARTAAAAVLPVDEFALAYDTARRFLGAARLETHASTLALTTVHCQLALGYLGVAYVRAAQTRKNRLLLTGGGADGGQAKLPAASFLRSALRFMACTGVPYLLQRTVLESINSHLEIAFQHRVEFALRVELVLGDSAALGATAASSHSTRTRRPWRT
jgi:hypothetical protein